MSDFEEARGQGQSNSDFALIYDQIVFQAHPISACSLIGELGQLGIHSRKQSNEKDLVDGLINIIVNNNVAATLLCSNLNPLIMTGQRYNKVNLTPTTGILSQGEPSHCGGNKLKFDSRSSGQEARIIY